MRILVTGGAGFIGKHLCRRLQGEGHEVLSLDISHDPDDDSGDLEDMNGTVCGDIADRYTLHNWKTIAHWDRFYHLACHASPVRYQREPIATANTCFCGTRNALAFSREHGCRILLASTSEIYGEPEVHPQPESYRGNVNCLGPRACYDEGKRMAECLMMDYHRQHGTDTRIARIFNTYGPGMDFDDGRVISNFVTQALKGEPLTIYGDGSQTRSFCYIDDMVEGLIRLMEYEGDECHEPHNLGNPGEKSIGDITHAVTEAVNESNRRIIQPLARYEDHLTMTIAQPLPQDDPTRRCPDITRAKKNLGWEPKTSLTEGLKRTAEDFRARMETVQFQVLDVAHVLHDGA